MDDPLSFYAPSNWGCCSSRRFYVMSLWRILGNVACAVG